MNIQDTNIYPLNMDKVSKSRGGSLPDKEAITDGIGTLVLGDINLNKNKYSNKTYNKILSDNKKDLVVDKTNPTNNINLENLITNNIITLDTNILNNINYNKVVNENQISLHQDGDSCNDGNSLTINDQYKNQICFGYIENIISPTINLKYGYASGSCVNSSYNYSNGINIASKNKIQIWNTTGWTLIGYYYWKSHPGCYNPDYIAYGLLYTKNIYSCPTDYILKTNNTCYSLVKKCPLNT